MTDPDAEFWAAYDAKQASRRRDPLLTLEDGEDAIRSALKRTARPLEVGGFRPSGALEATCFGEVRLSLPGEAWPTHNGTPMFPLAQLNITQAGIQGGPLADRALITIYMSHEFQSSDHTLSRPDGEAGFAVRSYPSVDGLVPVDAPNYESPLKPFECQWLDPVDDYANNDLAGDMVDTAEISVYDFYWHQTSALTKVGGWPATIQSEPWWMYQPDAPEVDFALQIMREDKAGWYCDSLFLARGRDDPDLWAADVQMY